ncbi:MAG: response regulator [Calditerrivibrio sp.]|nr:response regulator [Calditerrivibrio sp.]
MKNRVLLVDDSITIHRVIDLSLDGDIYEVGKVFTYEEAIPRIKSFNPEVILLDNKLEGVNVKQFVDEIRSLTSAKIILLVGAFDNFDEAKLSEFKSDGFLVKPFNSQSLEEKLVKLLPLKEIDDIVVDVPEKDAAVEELMSKIQEDVDFDNKVYTNSNTAFESADVSIDLDSSSSVKQDIPDIEKLDSAKDSKIDEIDLGDIFDGFEEIDSNLVAENKDDEEVESAKELFEDLEKDIDDVKFDKSDVLADMVDESIDIAKEDDTSVDIVSSEILEEDIEEDKNKDIDIEIDTKIELPADIELKNSDLISEKLESFDDSISEKTDISASDDSSGNLISNYDTSNLEQVVKSSIKSALKDIEISKDIVKNVVADIIDEDMIRGVIKESLGKHLEKVIWEVVPELAEKLIIAEIEKIKSLNR